MRKAKETQPSMRLKVVEFSPATEEALFEKENRGAPAGLDEPR